MIKTFTLDSKIFANENPLITGEYHQALRTGNLLADILLYERIQRKFG